MTQKICTRCKHEKPLEAFAICRSARDGLQFWCRQCQAEARYNDTISGRARLWKEKTRVCTSCEKRLWADGEEGLFNDDPKGKVCGICVRRPILIEERRQRRIQAGLKAWAEHSGGTYTPPEVPPEAPPKRHRRSAPKKPSVPARSSATKGMSPSGYFDMLMAEQKALEASAAKRAARLLRAASK